jgi:hypothetical protein
MFASAHFTCLPPLPARREQVGRSQGFHNHVHDPQDVFHGPQILLHALQGISTTDYVSRSVLCTDFKEHLKLTERKIGFSIL